MSEPMDRLLNEHQRTWFEAQNVMVRRAIRDMARELAAKKQGREEVELPRMVNVMIAEWGEAR